MLNLVAAFDDGLVGTIESLFETFLRLAGRKKIVYGLKMEHQRLKTLQQRVVQLAGDSSSFGQAFFKSQGELGFRQFAHSGYHRCNYQSRDQERKRGHDVERVLRTVRCEQWNEIVMQARHRDQG